MPQQADYIVLGGGLAGLAAAAELGSQAIVLERENRPGGLVRTENFDGYWFDHVLHLLHFHNSEIERRVRAMFGDTLGPCSPDAFVETLAGTGRFPIQFHLADLNPEVVVSCLCDLAEVTFAPDKLPTQEYETYLKRQFGAALCDLFHYPYNRKMWRRPLNTLSTSDFTWNIATPNIEEALRGAIRTNTTHEPYNANGWYPRPSHDAPSRGMELLTHRLAEQVDDLRLNHRVESINLATQEVTVNAQGRPLRLHYRQACVNSLPLPLAVGLCVDAPTKLKDRCHQLTHNRIRSVCFSVRGPRPQRRGVWRYYADERLAFTRLIHMHEFDSLTAPPDGWGLIAEVTERAEEPPASAKYLIQRTQRDCEIAGAFPEGSTVIDANVITADPAYVVFTPKAQSIIAESRQFLEEHKVFCVGRYGKWEYSSMAQVLEDTWSNMASLLASTNKQSRTTSSGNRLSSEGHTTT